MAERLIPVDGDLEAGYRRNCVESVGDINRNAATAAGKGRINVGVHIGKLYLKRDFVVGEGRGDAGLLESGGYKIAFLVVDRDFG